MEVKIFYKDITDMEVDAIVNAANQTLLGGGGLDGKIRKKAGPKLNEECENLKEIQPGIKALPGQAVITKGYNLKAKYIIHAVGPNYEKDKNPSQTLREAYENSLKLAEEYSLKSIAFPSISTGNYKYPFYESLKIVKNTIENFNYKSLEEVIICFNEQKKFIEALDYFLK